MLYQWCKYCEIIIFLVLFLNNGNFLKDSEYVEKNTYKDLSLSFLHSVTHSDSHFPDVLSQLTFNILLYISLSLSLFSFVSDDGATTTTTTTTVILNIPRYAYHSMIYV